MDLSIDITNACNRDCIHCLRDKFEPRKHLPLDLFNDILDQACSYGIKHISLTGGEPSIHPAWHDLLINLSESGLEFSFISNGSEFKKRTLPVLDEPIVKRYLDCICFSLDGATEKTHDALRGENSFHEVIEAANICRLKGIPLSFKTVVTNDNKNELIDIALLSANLGANTHSFLTLVPTPRLIDNKLVPSFKETKKIYSLITGNLALSLKTQIVLEGSWGVDNYLFACNAYQQTYAVDHLGNLIFCCNLSHVCNGDKPSIIGKEFLVDIKREGLGEGIIRHYDLLAKFARDRLKAEANSTEFFPYPCIWCLDYFGKLEWTKNNPYLYEVGRLLS